MDIAFVLGTGLDQIAEKLENPKIIQYKNIKSMPQWGALGHKG